jgi:hypothetical protein
MSKYKDFILTKLGIRNKIFILYFSCNLKVQIYLFISKQDVSLQTSYTISNPSECIFYIFDYNVCSCNKRYL